MIKWLNTKSYLSGILEYPHLKIHATIIMLCIIMHMTGSIGLIIGPWCNHVQCKAFKCFYDASRIRNDTHTLPCQKRRDFFTNSAFRITKLWSVVALYKKKHFLRNNLLVFLVLEIFAVTFSYIKSVCLGFIQASRREHIHWCSSLINMFYKFWQPESFLIIH